MRVLVTGGAGFIGHYVVRLLEAQDHTVAILDNFSNANGALYDERLDGINAKIYQSNIHDVIGRTHVSIFKPDVIIHLASLANSKAVDADPVAAVQSMITGLENMLLVAGRVASVKRFIFISSSMVYGDFDGDEVDERSPKKPINLYGTLKLAGEQMTKLYAERSGFEYVIIRPSAVYGPRDTNDRVIAKFFQLAIKNEILYCNGANPSLDFTYVSDIAEGIILAATSSMCNKVVFNMTYGSAERLWDAATYIVEITESKSFINWRKMQKEIPDRGRLDCSKAKETFGFNPQIKLHEGLELYYEWICKDTHTV